MNLAEIPRRIVSPYGSSQAKIMIVGEAPGKTEDTEGEPFVGPAGKLLTQLINIAGIPRTSTYMHNVVPIRPKGNDIKEFITISDKGVHATPDYYKYEKELYELIDKSKANVIVAVGGTAMYALTRRIGIMKWRGSILSFTYNGKMHKVIPIIHPSATLRDNKGKEQSSMYASGGSTYIWQHLIIKDLKRVREESKSPELSLPARVLHIRPTYDEIINFLREIEKSGKDVGLDIEVMRRSISCISIGTDPFEVMSIPFIDGAHNDYLSPLQEVEVWDLLSYIFEDEKRIKIGHNIFFDADFIFQDYGIRAFPVKDTMVAQAILYPELRKGLDFVTSWWTREPYYKDDGKQYTKFGGSDDDFWRYNALDTAIVLEALPKMEGVINSINNTKTYDRQTKLIEPLIYMNNRGMRIDIEEKNILSVKAEQKIIMLQEKLNKEVGTYINPKSSQQVMNYFYIVKGHKPYLKKGVPTSEESALKRLARKGEKAAQIMLEMRRLSTLKSRYLDMILSKDGRLRTSFNPVGAADSGRLSSSKNIFKEGGNIQNLHPEFLRLIIADEGHVLYSMDLKQADMRVVAYIAPEFKMIDAFESNRDVHKQTAALMFHKTIQEISDEEGSSSIGGGLFSERFWGKKANHEFNYGIGYRTFAYQQEIPENEGKLIYTQYHNAYPGLHNSYYPWIQDKLAHNRTLITCEPFLRKRTFLAKWGYDLFNEAYSFIPQSTVADTVNEWGLNFIYYNNDLDIAKVDLLNQIHDSIVFQISLKHSWKKHARAINLIKSSLEQTLRFEGRSFYIPIDLAMGFRLGKKNMKNIDLSMPVYLDMELEDAYKQIMEGQ
uniref:Putative DNA polymerase n=1 Tax=viral metagenome TaxID=1070528 RepID=A0A6M3KN76_9ZZZZ